jgi:2-polyprenyl-6-methoxyphenol hydroxylase-like FAD-dependent oxidoreductase
MHVVIVGGGFTGMAAAAALSNDGARVTVLEATNSVSPQFRGELIHPKGVRALEALGLKAPLMKADAIAIEGFAVTPSADAELLRLPYGQQHGHGLGIDHHAMVLAMRSALSTRPNITVELGAKVTGFARSAGRVVGVTQGEVTRTADLVVVADGRNSRLRTQLDLAPDIRLLSHTIVFSVQGELPAARHGHVFLGAPGPILAYPYGPNLIRFCVDVPLGAARGREAIVELLLTKYAPFVPAALREAMVHSLRTVPFEGCATHAISTTRCAAPGVVLVGDSGGCAHPLTAGGMTNALNDVLTLSDELTQRGPTNDALHRYQRRRYDYVRMREMFTDALYEVFCATDPGARALQAGVFSYWRSSPRSQAASMDILSGEEVRPSRFIAEYSMVAGLSALDTLKGVRRQPQLKQRAHVLKSLAQTGLTRIEDAVGRTAKTALQRYRLRLADVDASAP